MQFDMAKSQHSSRVTIYRSQPHRAGVKGRRILAEGDLARLKRRLRILGAYLSTSALMAMPFSAQAKDQAWTLGSPAATSAASAPPAKAGTSAKQGAATRSAKPSAKSAAAPKTVPSAPAPAAVQAPSTVAAAPAQAVTAPAPQTEVIRSISVKGAQRLEPETIVSYMSMRVGQPYSQADADQALKDLYDTELFSDVQISNSNGAVTVTVQESPVINRIVLEGNKSIKDEKINPEIKLAPRQIFTRSKVRADVNRIIELYKRQGRFAATVEPKMVNLDQNRVDIVFEIQEGPKSKVRQINIIGNEKFSDGQLRGEMVTKQSRPWRFLSSSDTYDPDKMAFDQQKLRQFYLTQGYADFRVISAVAELTPDKRDFIITYNVEEGPRYKFGDVKVDSELRDFNSEELTKALSMKKGDWYNAKAVEDTVNQLTETAGLVGYAFADVDPRFKRDATDHTMSITFALKQAPRTYVEGININGNTITKDKVIRREFRLTEGDAFNSVQVKRSTERIKSLGYFQDKFEVTQKPGSSLDRILLEANVEEKSTGQLQFSAGYSSLEKLILQASITQNNFRGMGQTANASINYSSYGKSAEVSFFEPYTFNRAIQTGINIYRRDYNSFNYIGGSRQTTYKQTTTGFSLSAGVALNERFNLVANYTLNFDDVSLDQSTYFSNVNGVSACDPLLAGRYLCDSLGKRTSSIFGTSLVYNNLNNYIHPSRGEKVVLSGNVAGLGGNVKYLRGTINAAKYWNVHKGFIFSIRGEAGIITAPASEGNVAQGIDSVRITDRFFLGEPQMRGFDIRGVGPRVVRRYYDTATADPTDFIPDSKNRVDDALGGHKYYLTRAELEIPLGAGAKEMGLRPSIFVDMGAVAGLTTPQLYDLPTGQTRDILNASGQQQCYNSTTAAISALPAGGSCPTGSSLYQSTVPAFKEFYYGNSLKPRLSVGIGVNWNSPFGPFRIDIAKALLKQPGDDVKVVTFNVGTSF